MRPDIRIPYKHDTAIIGVDFGDDRGDMTAVSMMCGNCNAVIQNGVSKDSDEINLKILKRCPSCGREFKYIDGAIANSLYRPEMKQ
ncbi:hypothetical protein QTL86_11215 [Cellulosilyticum sp. ST5]|uniref:hypothetical protein n=1 Tax=Cellulosilyticum sp. ST5 TaxID=3055805 RepID=UPI003977B5B4